MKAGKRARALQKKCMGPSFSGREAATARISCEWPVPEGPAPASPDTPTLAEGPAPAFPDTLTVPASRPPASGRARLPPSRRRRHTRARQSTGATATPAHPRSHLPVFTPAAAHGEPLRDRRTATPAHPRSSVHRRYGNAGTTALACSRCSAGHGPARVSAPSPRQRRRHARARPFQMSRRPRVPPCGSSWRRQHRRPLDVDDPASDHGRRCIDRRPPTTACPRSLFPHRVPLALLPAASLRRRLPGTPVRRRCRFARSSTTAWPRSLRRLASCSRSPPAASLHRRSSKYAPRTTVASLAPSPRPARARCSSDASSSPARPAACRAGRREPIPSATYDVTLTESYRYACLRDPALQQSRTHERNGTRRQGNRRGR